MLNGSRANPNAPKDFMQDYDVVFFLDGFSEIYKQDRAWMSRFGDLAICQQNDFDDGNYRASENGSCKARGRNAS